MKLTIILEYKPEAESGRPPYIFLKCTKNEEKLLETVFKPHHHLYNKYIPLNIFLNMGDLRGEIERRFDVYIHNLWDDANFTEIRKFILSVISDRLKRTNEGGDEEFLVTSNGLFRVDIVSGKRSIYKELTSDLKKEVDALDNFAKEM